MPESLPGASLSLPSVEIESQWRARKREQRGIFPTVTVRASVGEKPPPKRSLDGAPSRVEKDGIAWAARHPPCLAYTSGRKGAPPAPNGFEQYTRKTRRAIFLEEMEQVVPWRELCALVAPHYPKPGNGRPPVGVERMLRIYFLQQWFNLSDPAVEEALYDSGVMRQFVGIDLGCEPVPDETTVCKFRHLLEEHQLGGTDPGAGEPAPAGAGGANHDGHDRGRDHPARN